MSDVDFIRPQRQSKVGILLIFSKAVFLFIRNFWVLGVYFLVNENSEDIITLSILALGVMLVLTIIYSVLSYLKFVFFIDVGKGEFVLEKGVISSEVIAIPFEKIQQVNLKRDLLQRLVGVYSVVVDTAGSKDKEVEIKALSRRQADLLSDSLMKLASRGRESGPDTVAEEVGPEIQKDDSVQWEHKLDFLTLLKLGLTSNYFRGLAVLIAFYFTLREQFQFTNEFMEIEDLFIMEMASTIVIILVLIVIGMLITVGETFLKYYNLRLRKSTAGLQVEMGLRENTRVNLKAERVQLLQVVTNPLQKRLGLFKLKISLASSQDDLSKDRIQIPGIPEAVVERIYEYFYSSQFTERQVIMPDKLVLFRRIGRGFIPLLLFSLLFIFSFISFTWQWVVFAAIAYTSFMIVFQVLYFRSLRLSVSEDFLIKSSGVWIKKKQILEIYKLQSVTISQPVWYKKKELVNLIFHTAGGEVHFSFIRKEEAVPLMNYMLYKIEAVDTPWM